MTLVTENDDLLVLPMLQRRNRECGEEKTSRIKTRYNRSDEFWYTSVFSVIFAKRGGNF